MGGAASRDRQELATRTSFGPQQIISVPSLGANSIGGPSTAPLLPQQPATRFGGLGAQGDAPVPVEQVPRLSVQQTCVVKNPVNLHKHSLKCYKVCLIGSLSMYCCVSIAAAELRILWTRGHGAESVRGSSACRAVLRPSLVSVLGRKRGFRIVHVFDATTEVWLFLCTMDSL